MQCLFKPLQPRDILFLLSPIPKFTTTYPPSPSPTPHPQILRPAAETSPLLPLHLQLQRQLYLYVNPIPRQTPASKPAPPPPPPAPTLRKGGLLSPTPTHHPHILAAMAPLPAAKPAEPVERLPMPSRNPLPLSAGQETQVRDLYFARVRALCGAEIKGSSSLLLVFVPASVCWGSMVQLRGGCSCAHC